MNPNLLAKPRSAARSKASAPERIMPLVSIDRLAADVGGNLKYNPRCWGGQMRSGISNLLAQVAMTQ